uniref:Peroxisomal biosis factor 5 like n=1 Tax=Lepisosteus oculatus TaxID=7918 RepID=W5LZI1_LEPOC
MYQGHVQGKDSRAADKAVAMVMKEIPSKESSEGKPLLTVTTQLVNEQQESRPLLSPSIDDFLCETKSDVASRPVTSNTAVLSPSLDLLDLSDPSEGRSCKAGKRAEGAKGTPPRKKMDETELIQVDVERSASSSRAPERASLDSVTVASPLEKWEEVSSHAERNGSRKWKLERRRSSRHSSSEFLWPSESRAQSESSAKNSLEASSSLEVEPVAASQGRSSKEQRWGSALLSRNHSLEEEFERAKAAVESDTEFWDKMQAEWEELARRNWLTENQSPQIPSSISPHEKGYYFHTDNPYKDWPNAFEEGVRKAREGDLPNAVLLLEAAILQDPQDSEAWQVLGTTQAENENEQAAIVSLQRMLIESHSTCYALKSPVLKKSCMNHHHGQEEIIGRIITEPRPTFPRTQHNYTAGPHSCSVSCHTKFTALSMRKEKHKLVNSKKETFNQPKQLLKYHKGKDLRDSFIAASFQKNDYLLWNRLGATLANGDRSEEAVEAYTKALELQPGFIRSRYNLGISCINLGAHREAASNFLTALSLQRKSRSRQLSHQVMSGNIWAALRIALSMMDQPELFQAANIGDLDLLMRAFKLDM